MSFYIIGAGGHAKVITEIAELANLKVDGYLDDNFSEKQFSFDGIYFVGPIKELSSGESIIAIGDNKIRKFISDEYNHINWKKLFHPRAIVSNSALIGVGTVIMAGAIIQPGVTIGRHCIINTGACVDHDCVIDDFCHIGPNAALAGGVRIGEGAFVGIGSSVIPYISIGKWSTIGAGSAVINNIPDKCVAAGVPAVIKKFINE